VSKRQITGRQGETIAADYLANQQYHILHRNWRCAIGELDIVVEKDDFLVFVEVRTRTSNRFGTPEESITAAKQQRLVDLAQTYLQEEQPGHVNWRIDVIAVHLNSHPPTINHIQNAVGW
jgi:putative endonuclease